jgi:hypothetical protein
MNPNASCVPMRHAELLSPKCGRDDFAQFTLTKQNVPCDSTISMTVSLSGTSYAVASSQLVQQRNEGGQSCWSSIVAWSNGSVPEQLGEVRLGTPFMSGVYS